MIKKFTIYGERCSGTTYLQYLINENFDVKITWEYGWKHFFGFQDNKLKNSDETLFICIVRNPVDWINSFYRDKHHIPLEIKNKIENNFENFLNTEFWSYDKKKNNEIKEDRNIYTGKKYKNIFELRHTKIKWMIEDLPKKVKNYIFIKYEDLVNNFTDVMNQIKDKGLSIRKNIKFPINTNNYKGNRKNKFIKKKNDYSSEIILSNPNFIKFYEEKLEYI